MRVVFAGTPRAALPALRALLDSHHDVLAVLTRPDAPRGRGRRLAPSPVAELAAERGLETLRPVKPSEPAFLDRLAELAPDCCPVVGYGALVPGRALVIPRNGWINLHFSQLPAWRGAAPVQHALLAGDEMTGASVFHLEAGLDTGPVYGVSTEPVRPRDTAGELLDRLAHAGAGLLVSALDGIEAGTLRAAPQPADGVTTAPKITVGDAHVDWTAPAFAVDRRVRACTPDPGGWTTFRDARLGLGPVTPVDDSPSLDPGEPVVERRRVLVGTGTGPVELGDLRPAGRRPMSAVDWARGTRPGPGERLV